MVFNNCFQAEMSDKMEVNEGQDDRYDDNESEEIDPGNDNLQIDESEDVDVTEPDNKIPRMDNSEQCCNNEGKGAIYTFLKP